MIEDNTHTDDFKRKTHCANVGIRQKLIVRILEFYKNSVSKFLENKKLNVLDMGYTLGFPLQALFILSKKSDMM